MGATRDVWGPPEHERVAVAKQAARRKDDALTAIQGLCDEADAMHPDQFPSDTHLPLAFRGVDYKAAFLRLTGIVNRIEEALVDAEATP